VLRVMIISYLTGPAQIEALWKALRVAAAKVSERKSAKIS
jgi:hypothetical protein